MEERLVREASLAIHHEFEVDDELKSNDRLLAGDGFSENEFDNVSNNIGIELCWGFLSISCS